jgi:hypothetical protein
MSEKDVHPVAKVHVHKTGGNAGVQWSAVAVNGYDSLPLLEDGTLLYLAPPAADVAKLVEALRDVIDAADGDGWKQLDPSLRKQRAALAKWEGK